MIKSVSFILLFIFKCLHRINKRKSIINTVQEKYGRNVMKCLRQLERMKLKHYRLERHNEFLRICLIYNSIPKFIRFKPYNTHFYHTRKYQELCRSMMCNLFKEQQKRINKMNVDIKNNELGIRNIVNYTTWLEIELHFNKIILNEKKAINDRHSKKLEALKIPFDKTEFNKKLVYNFSYRALSAVEESLLSKGWKYAITHNKLNSLEVKTDIEYMYYCMNKNLLLKDNEKANKIKTILNEFGNKLKMKIDNEIPNLSSEERNAISTLLKEHSLVISKVDKGNAIVVMNKSDYLFKAKEILNDDKSFKKLNFNLTEEREKELINFLLELKRNKSISLEEYNVMRPDTGSRTPEAYFLVKVHKLGQPVRPIISSYNSYNFKTAKYLALLLKPCISKCPSYIKDSFDFAKIIKENKNMPGTMCSLDVTSLFTNVPLDKTIEIAIKKIKILHPKLKIDDKNLRELFYYCTKRTNFIFNNENYDQINGVSMGSPLAPILAHLYMSELEKNIIKFKGKKPSIFYRYVDDIFIIFNGTHREISLFLNFMNKLETSIKFTLEIQNDNKLPFLDVMVERKNSELITYIYRKPTDTGLYLKWTSSQPRNYKINLIKCLCIRAKRICSSNSLFKQELDYYKKVFSNNGYPMNVIKKTIRSVELNINNKKNVSQNKEKVFISIPYYGECSIILANKIRKIIETPLTHIIFGFKARNKISTLFSKTYQGMYDNKRIVYGYSCHHCNGYYIGQTSRGSEVRKKEHMKAFNGIGYSKIAEHCLNNKHLNNWDTDILAIESNDLKRNIKESLLMDWYSKKKDKIVYSQKSFILNIF